MANVTLRLTLAGLPPSVLTGAVHAAWALRSDITCWLGLDPLAQWVFVTSVTGTANGVAALPVPLTWRAPANAALPSATPVPGIDGCSSQPDLSPASAARLLRRRTLAAGANSTVLGVVVVMENAAATWASEVASRLDGVSNGQSVPVSVLLPRLFAVAADALPGVNLAASAATVDVLATGAPPQNGGSNMNAAKAAQAVSPRSSLGAAVGGSVAGLVVVLALVALHVRRRRQAAAAAAAGAGAAATLKQGDSGVRAEAKCSGGSAPAVGATTTTNPVLGAAAGSNNPLFRRDGSSCSRSALTLRQGTSDEADPSGGSGSRSGRDSDHDVELAAGATAGGALGTISARGSSRNTNGGSGTPPQQRGQGSPRSRRGKSAQRSTAAGGQGSTAGGSAQSTLRAPGAQSGTPRSAAVARAAATPRASESDSASDLDAPPRTARGSRRG